MSIPSYSPAAGYSPRANFSPTVVVEMSRLSPTVARMTSGDEELKNLFCHLWHPDSIVECLELATARWGTNDRHVLASLWWYNAAHCIMAMAFTGWVTTGRVVVPHPDDPIAIRRDDGYLAGWKPRVQLDLDAGLNHITQMIVPVIAGLKLASGKPEAPYWALASDAPAMAAATAAITFPPSKRLRIWRQLEAFHLAWQRFAPIPRLRLLEDELRPGSLALSAAIDTSPAPKAYRRVSCCLLYRTGENRKCRFCPKRRLGSTTNLSMGKVDGRLGRSTFPNKRKPGL